MPTCTAHEAPTPLRDRLAGLLLLGGTIRHTDLSRGLDRPLVDLPVAPETSVLDLWQREAAGLAERLETDRLDVRLLLDPSSGTPRRSPVPGVNLSCERDRRDFRGSGGVLRDACEGYAPDTFVLVSTANQILIEPMAALATALADAGGDIAILAHDDGTPVGFMLVSVAAAMAIRSVGFVDFKEQALPQLAATYDVRVVRRPVATGVPIRTLRGYLNGLRAYQRSRAGLSPFEGPFADDWVSTFGVIEPGATVDPRARIHDSAVLAGGHVGAGAVVVRSVVCGTGRVPPGEVAADRVVSAAAESNGRSA